MNGTTLFVHAAQVSLDATERALLDYPALRTRHAIDPGLVDPTASGFSPGDDDYAGLQSFVRAELKNGDARIVLSCSVYNGFADRLAADLNVPVERSDDAGAREAARYGRLGLAVSYPPSYELIRSHIESIASGSNTEIAIEPLLRSNAFALASDAHSYATAIDQAIGAANGVDAIFLAQYSMDPYRDRARRTAMVPVISALESSLRRLNARAGS